MTDEPRCLARLIVALAAASAFLSSMSLALGPFGLFVLPGLLFGLIVLLPLGRCLDASDTRIVLSILGSGVGYFIAVNLFLKGNALLTPLGGALGSLLATSPLLLSQDARILLRLPIAVFTGALASCAGGLMMVLLPGDALKMIGIMVIWQVGVALSAFVRL